MDALAGARRACQQTTNESGLALLGGAITSPDLFLLFPQQILLVHQCTRAGKLPLSIFVVLLLALFYQISGYDIHPKFVTVIRRIP
jgi:hypothetical protein